MLLKWNFASLSPSRNAFLELFHEHYVLRINLWFVSYAKKYHVYFNALEVTTNLYIAPTLCSMLLDGAAIFRETTECRDWTSDLTRVTTSSGSIYPGVFFGGGANSAKNFPSLPILHLPHFIFHIFLFKKKWWSNAPFLPSCIHSGLW